MLVGSLMSNVVGAFDGSLLFVIDRASDRSLASVVMKPCV